MTDITERSRRFVCCNIVLSERRRWRMTAAMIKHVQVLARVRKGLDEETYRLNLAAVGATSTTKLTRNQHSELMLRLGRYPDSPKWLTRGQRRAVAETEAAMDKAKIQAAIDEYERMRAVVGGCGDGNCCIQKPAGMQTNGGCQCHHSRLKACLMMRAGRQFHAAVVAALNG